MAAVSTFEIYGIQEALKALNDLDRTLRRQITKDIQGGAGQKLVSAARSFIPTMKPPLSGMGRSPMIGGRETTQWDRDQVVRGIRTIVGQRARPPKTITFSNGRTVQFKGTPYQLLVLQQKDAAGAIWDHAGIRNSSSMFVQNLITKGERVGPADAPRALQPAAEDVTPSVEGEVRKIVEDVMRIINRKLV
jgi:hypothetical protein